VEDRQAPNDSRRTVITLPHVLSFVSSIAGAIAVMFWRVQEGRTAVSPKKIVIPPLGMSTGLAMFVVPMFRVPWLWAVAAFLAGALILAYPLLKTSRLVRDGDRVMMQRSNVFFGVLILLAIIRIGARGYLDTVLTIQQTAGLFFLLAFGMIVRWRAQMYVEYRALMREDRADTTPQSAQA
jgi:membrane protein CcdC involved in cytochrome C biogenesis